MTDQLLRERQDAGIWNAIEANNFKQALKLVEKRLAKKHTDYLEALKIYIRSRSSLLSERSAVLIHLEELPRRKPPLTDLDSLDLYDDAWGEVLPNKLGNWGNIIGELRWQCVKAAPKNEDLALKCFQECLSNSDLDHARQISNSLEKTFPNNHAYVFWNISTMFLYSTSQSCPEAQKKIWGGLALGQIGKLAVATRQASDQKKLPVRSIHTPQELLLLHRITKEYGKSEQRLEYLSDVRLGPDSVVAKGEWELWRFRLKLLEDAGQWQELFAISSRLLQRARTKSPLGNVLEPGMNDWIIWMAFIRSAVELPGHKSKAKVLAEMEVHLDPASGIDKSWRRNASLAWVKFCFSTTTPFAVIPGTEGEGQVLNHIPIIIKYLQKYGDAITAFNDLKPYVEALDNAERSQLLVILNSGKVFRNEVNGLAKALGPQGEDLSTATTITQATNIYKLRYLLQSALSEHERRHSPLSKLGAQIPTCNSCSQASGQFCCFCLAGLAKDSADAYRIAINDDGRISSTLLTTDRHPADDLCLLAAMCLVKLSLADTSSHPEPLSNLKDTYILQATALLEYGWSRSKSNFQLSLFLLRLYLRLGCGSLAMRAYQRLALKQIQLDTLSYTMFDRISSQHPHKFNHQPDGSPLADLYELLRKQQKLYRGARNQISKNMWTSFKQGNYNSIFEIQEVSHTLSLTLSGAMSVIESRKISRITEPTIPLNSIVDGYDILPPNIEDSKTTFVDTNDFDTFPNFESSRGLSFEKLSRYAPAPSESRYRVDLTAEKLKQLLDPSLPQGGETEMLQKWLENLVDSENFAGSEIEGTTTCEQLASQAYNSIAIIARDACDNTRRSVEELATRLVSSNTALLSSIGRLVTLVSNIKQLVPAMSSTLHTLYVACDVGKTALHFSNYLSKKGRDIDEKQVEQLKLVEEVARQLLQAILDKSLLIKQGLDESGWIDKVLESILPEGNHEAEATTSVLKLLIDENFLEEWAGLVVESWRDSAAGLTLLKPVKL